MLIHEVCRACHLTRKAVEYYVEQGLIQPEVMDNGYRCFSQSDVSALKRIAVLRGLGFSVPEIRTVLKKDSLSAIHDVLHKRELEIDGLQARQALLRQLADSGDWARAQIQLEALQKKQSILTRILDKFPGSYGQFVCVHFAPYLGEPIVTREQQDAFETIIDFLDGLSVVLPTDLQAYLDESIGWAVKMQDVTSAALAAAIENPEQYIQDNRELLERFRAVMDSEAYKATPAYRLKAHLQQFQRESGYTDVFIPAMLRLSPSYRAYYEALQAANEVFIRQFPDQSPRH